MLPAAQEKVLTVFAIHDPAIGEWVAHCLDLDLVSQGPTIPDAMNAMNESLGIVFNDDLASGLNPFDRRAAPAEYWDQMKAVMAQGQEEALVARLRVKIQLADGRRFEIPPPWQIAAPESLRPSHA